MEVALQEICEAAEAWFGTGRTRRSGPEYARLEAALDAGRKALVETKRARVRAMTDELDALEDMAFSTANGDDAEDTPAEEEDEDDVEESPLSSEVVFDPANADPGEEAGDGEGT